MITRNEIIELVESHIKENADLFKVGELTYEELHNYQYILFSILEDLKVKESIYVIEYNAYEYDDYNSGDTRPIYVSFKEDRRDSEWNRIINNAKSDVKKWSKEDDSEYAEIWEDTPERFKYTIGKWIYTYEKYKYPLDKNIQYNN